MIRRWFWLDGRLAWPFFAVVVLITLFAVVFDFGWRVLVMPFETYLLVFGLIGAVILIATAGVWLSRRAGAPARERHPSTASKGL